MTEQLKHIPLMDIISRILTALVVAGLIGIYSQLQTATQELARFRGDIQTIDTLTKSLILQNQKDIARFYEMHEQLRERVRKTEQAQAREEREERNR